MTLGRLAAKTLGAGVNTLIYTVPERSNGFSTAVNISNRNDTDVKIRIALVDGVVADLSSEDYIEYDVTVRANGVLERDGIDMTIGQSIVGYSDTGNVSFTMWS